MRRALSVSCLLLLAVYVCLMNGQQAPRSTVFEGARLIVGDGMMIEDSAFIIEGLPIPGGSAEYSFAGGKWTGPHCARSGKPDGPEADLDL